MVIVNLLHKFIDVASELLPSEYSELIIVAGPPRSGTTWLHREICNGVDMFPFLPECTLLTQQVELYSKTLKYCDPQRFNAYFANKQNLLAYFRCNVNRLINQVASLNRKSNSKTLVLKDPEFSLYLVELKELLPKHKLIVLVRDPRDVLASMKNVSIKKNIQWNVQDSANQLFSYYYQIDRFQQQVPPDCIFLRYEDLVSGKVDSLQRFLQLPVLNNLFCKDQIANVLDQLDTADPFFSELYLQPTTKDKIGSYLQVLSIEEVRHVEMVYSGVIQQWGY
jgi:hypothetical protein